MRSGPLALTLIALLTGAALAAEVEWWPATVTLSDGTVLAGRVHVPGGALVIHHEGQARRYTVRIAEIKVLETAIERQSMEGKWLFRESGLDDKVYTGETQPVRHYLTRITFHDGRRLEGHVMPKTLYAASGGVRRKFILRAKHEGKVGQALQDLGYVRSVEFAAGGGVRGTIEGTLLLPDGEMLRKVLAVNRDRLFSIEGSLNPLSGKFRVADCTEGRYDLVAVTDKALYAFFGRERDEGCARLDSVKVAEIQAWVSKLRDFFHEQEIIYAAGDERRAFALVRMERHGGTTLKGAGLIRRYDVWAMHRPKDQWQIEKRMYVDRLVSEEAIVTRRRLTIVPGLGGHRIAEGTESLELTVKLAPNSELPVPAPPEPKEQQRGG